MKQEQIEQVEKLLATKDDNDVLTALNNKAIGTIEMARIWVKYPNRKPKQLGGLFEVAPIFEIPGTNFSLEVIQDGADMTSYIINRPSAAFQQEIFERPMEEVKVVAKLAIMIREYRNI